MIEIIKRAIALKKPIKFEYVRPDKDKVRGKRIGNPHVIFGGTTKEGLQRVWVHIAQTGGVSDTLVVFPDWRMFIMEYITEVTILEEEPCFDIQEGYNPDSEMYTHAFAKV